MSDPTQSAVPAAPGAPAPASASAGSQIGATWAPPGSAPFGPPVGSAPSGTAPSGAPTGVQPGAVYAAPVGHLAPGQGYPAYAPTPAGAPPAPRSAVLGWVALALSLVAVVGAGIAAAVASFAIGSGTGSDIVSGAMPSEFDWSFLTPVRDSVLLGEVSFWVGTALGVWALVQGIIAIVTRRGRGPGIAAVVIAAIGPIAFALLVQGFLAVGLATGSGIAG